MSEDFIREFKEDSSGKGICVDWHEIAFFQEFSIEFYNEFKNYINFDDLPISFVKENEKLILEFQEWEKNQQ